MTPDQITQIRQVLKKAKAIRKNGMTFNDTYTVQNGLGKIYDCVDEALALLPCSICNDTKKVMATGCWGTVHKEVDCPDCQENEKVCTKEGACTRYMDGTCEDCPDCK